MHKPFKGFSKGRYPNGSIIQAFGESPEIYLPYGMMGHNGIDLPSFYGDEIYAVEAGTVVVATMSPTGFGGEIKIVTPSGNEWTYAHLSAQYVTLNDEVREGQVIGLEGNTGSVVSVGLVAWGNQNPDMRGTHLHLGLRRFTPFNKATDTTWNCTYPNGLKGNILNYGNGYKGAIDFYGLLPEDTETTKHIFGVNMRYGETNNEILELQKRLHVKQTGYYGDLTKSAVYQFQLKNVQLSWYEKYVMRGSVCGQKTRSVLNSLSTSN